VLVVGVVGVVVGVVVVVVNREEEDTKPFPSITCYY